MGVTTPSAWQIWCVTDAYIHSVGVSSKALFMTEITISIERRFIIHSMKTSHKSFYTTLWLIVSHLWG